MHRAIPKQKSQRRRRASSKARTASQRSKRARVESQQARHESDKSVPTWVIAPGAPSLDSVPSTPTLRRNTRSTFDELGLAAPEAR